MAKSSPSYACTACGATSLRWVGKCPKCQEFGTVVEQAPASVKAVAQASRVRPATPVGDIASERIARIPTGAGEFDRAIGGGLVPGQVVLVAGEPGVGKSTLLLAVAHAFAEKTGGTVLYLSGEESADQIALRARRIGALSDRLLVADESDLYAVLGQIEHHRPQLVVVDSVQTIASPEVDGRAGGVSQVIEVTQSLTRTAKQRGIPLLLVGQSTKDNSVAGPRALEHLVDTVLTFEGERTTSLRLLRAAKNRYGPADEVVCFEQTEEGLREVLDPSELFRGHRDVPVPGTCVTVTVEGRRSLLAEIQALIGQGTSVSPRRTVTGLDTTRVVTLAAVTERSGSLPLSQHDVFVATVGGAQIADPAADLAICLAIASAARNTPVPADVLAIGEIALSGDVRPVPHLAQRVAEAKRLGFRRILVPAGSRERLKDPGVVELAHLSAALDAIDKHAGIAR
ncbi:MAG: DNA repair protein RadA [Candidatus Nanopelagicales bacterium]